MAGIRMFQFYLCGFLLQCTQSLNTGVTHRDCPTQPENASFPCTMYTLPQRYCTDELLAKLFPWLYEVEDEAWLSWPGPTVEQQTLSNNLTWSPPRDVRTRFLKGYQIIEIGMSFVTFGMTRCKVIDVSNITKKDYILLSETSFVLTNEYGGDMLVTVTPLPPFPVSGNGSTQTAAILPPSQQSKEYHPKLSVRVNYTQENASMVNVTVEIQPKVEGLETVIVQVVKDMRILQRIRLPISKEFLTIGNLTKGNFTLQFIPEDTSNFGTSGPCLCRTGTMCTACRRYIKDIVLGDITAEDASSKPRSVVSAVAIIVPLVILVLIATSGAAALVWVRRRDQLPSWFPCKHLIHLDDTNIGSTPRHYYHFLVVFATDHPPHCKVIKAFVDSLKSSFKCVIVMSSYEPDQTSSIYQKPNEQDENGDTRYSEFDVAFFIHSEWSYNLVTAVERGEVYREDVTDAPDIEFLRHLNKLCTSPALREKTVSVRFEYSSPSCVIREPFLGPLFNIPSNINAFLKHIHNKLNISPHALNGIQQETSVSLLSTINEAFLYQSRKRSWLGTKLIILKHFPPSNESESVLHHRKLTSRTIRSRSADTIFCSVCKSRLDSQSLYRDCEHCSSRRHRRYSCNISFCAPDITDEDTSLRMSLLESKFDRINCRYDAATLEHSLDC
ncbi:uncharacterized protein LOC128218284 [Mya arenaria]|uniref:uncharacterized protein LOC128218284 n=1 Tax=Mya arenaria TaxID=6604 RepID=UPI0022DED7D7|nr:uncharacterized protein LOC128218284 [Mya arenaria]